MQNGGRPFAKKKPAAEASISSEVRRNEKRGGDLRAFETKRQLVYYSGGDCLAAAFAPRDQSNTAQREQP
jgi:hypothetical protein